jgi:hypothetical protein
LDTSGNVLWDRQFVEKYPINLSSESSFRDFQQTQDKGYIITGFTHHDSSGIDIQNFWLVKTDSLGCIGTDCGYTGIDEQPASQTPSLAVYPNPTHSMATIAWDGLPMQKATLSLYDLLGREVLRQETEAANRTEVDLSGIERGLYIVRVSVGNQILTGKLVVD